MKFLDHEQFIKVRDRLCRTLTLEQRRTLGSQELVKRSSGRVMFLRSNPHHWMNVRSQEVWHQLNNSLKRKES